MIRKKDEEHPFRHFDEEWSCLEKSLEAVRDTTDENVYASTKRELAEQKEALLKYIEEGRFDIEKKMADARVTIIDKFDKYLPKGEDSAKTPVFSDIDREYERDLQEMQERHRRELETLTRRYKSSRKRVEKDRGRQIKRCAKIYHSVRANYENRLSTLDLEGQVQVRRLIEGIGIVDQDEVDPYVTLAPRYKFCKFY